MFLLLFKSKMIIVNNKITFNSTFSFMKQNSKINIQKYKKNDKIILEWSTIMKSIITIYIEDKDDYTSPYNNQKLNSELLSYILDENKGIPLNHIIEIEVNSPHLFSKNEKNDFVNILRSNLGEDIKESYLEMKLTHIRAIFLFFIGILFILFSSFISIHELISEIALIIGWVGIWEACYIFLFDNMHNRIKIKKFKKLVNAKVSFYEKN